MLGGAEGEAGHCWLQQAKLCRVSGHFEAGTRAGLEALGRQVAGAGLERAKLLWDMDKPHRAIVSLQEVSTYLCFQDSTFTMAARGCSKTLRCRYQSTRDQHVLVKAVLGFFTHCAVHICLEYDRLCQTETAKRCRLYRAGRMHTMHFQLQYCVHNSATG